MIKKIDVRTLLVTLDEFHLEFSNSKAYRDDKTTVSKLTKKWFALKADIEKFLAEEGMRVPIIITILNGLFDKYHNGGNKPNSKFFDEIEEKLGRQLRPYLYNLQ